MLLGPKATASHTYYVRVRPLLCEDMPNEDTKEILHPDTKASLLRVNAVSLLNNILELRNLAPEQYPDFEKDLDSKDFINTVASNESCISKRLRPKRIKKYTISEKKPKIVKECTIKKKPSPKQVRKNISGKKSAKV